MKRPLLLKMIKTLKITYGWTNSEYHAITRVFDKIDNIAMMQTRNVHTVDGQNPVAYVEAAASFRRTAGNYTADC